MPADTGFADVPAVGQKRQEHKERAQETLALGNPGDTLDVEGMHREKRGTLKSGKGGKGGTVKSRKQAIAIGLSEARKKGAKVPKKRS